MTTADLLDARFEAWLREAEIAEGALGNVRALSGGTQNLILRFTCGGQNLVLRRPPVGRPTALQTMRREAIVLAALAGTDVPHAQFRGICEDPEIIGGPFIVTDEVAGFNATEDMPGRAGSDPRFRHALGLSLVDALAALARVSIERGELASIGKVNGFVERQAARWAKQLASYDEIAGWQGPAALGPVAVVGEWLMANLPADTRTGLMHGDYHIANVLFDADEPRVAAVLDWELTALGDPMLDLARLTTVWPNARNEGLLSLKVEPWQGFPAVDELIERYAALTGRPMTALRWFQVLACYKYGIILEGTHARAAAGRADPATGARLHTSAKGLIARAATLIEQA